MKLSIQAIARGQRTVSYNNNVVISISDEEASMTHLSVGILGCGYEEKQSIIISEVVQHEFFS